MEARFRKLPQDSDSGFEGGSGRSMKLPCNIALLIGEEFSSGSPDLVIVVRMVLYRNKTTSIDIINHQCVHLL